MFYKKFRASKSAYTYQLNRQKAVALGYDPDQGAAPRVLASGDGLLAEKIIAIARENGVVIKEDPVLAGLLAQVDIGAEIPPALYAVVAEVLAYVYRLQNRRLERK
jgi:flagellar biosynthesis protein